MDRVSSFPDSRLESLYKGEGFGGAKTMRAKVIRELIDEIRALRRELVEVRTTERPIDQRSGQ
jgi:ribosomal protein L19E